MRFYCPTTTFIFTLTMIVNTTTIFIPASATNTETISTSDNFLHIKNFHSFDFCHQCQHVHTDQGAVPGRGQACQLVV